GGSFQRLGEIVANGCGRLLPDGSADGSFQCARPNADRFAQDSSGRVYALRSAGVNDALVRLQAGGTLDPSFATSNPTGSILDILILDDVIYLAGTFSAINGQPRARLARLDLDGSLDSAWTPTADNTVSRLLAPGDGFLYLSGGFTNINGSERDGLARLLPATAVVDAWHPLITGTGGVFPITGMDTDGNHLYLSGAFTAVQGLPRARLAKLGLDAAATVDADWAPQIVSAPDPSGPRLIKVIGNHVYLGVTGGGMNVSSNGDFATGRLRRVASGGTATLDLSFNPLADVTGTSSGGPLSLISGDGGGRLFVGGQISQLSLGAIRLGLAALNADGSVDGLSALTEALVPANVANLAFDPATGSTYVQGTFLKVNGVSRQGLIRLLASGAVDGGFRPAPTRYSAVAYANDAVYAADDDAGLLRKLDRLTGDPVPGYSPVAYSNSIAQIRIEGDHAYLLGNFVLTGITPQLTSIARLDLATDSIDQTFRFTPNAGASILFMARDAASNSLFLTGNFSTLNGITVNRVVRIDSNTLAIDSDFAPTVPVIPSAMLSDELGGLWLHGSFSTINGQTCRGPARLLIATQGGLDPDFSCNRGFVGGNSMALARDSVYIKGSNAISRFVRSAGGSADPDWVIANPPLSLGLTVFGDRLLAHGNFSSIAGANRQSLAAFPVVEYFGRSGFE
ncbi:MAG: delta-60 repeat domain-containing protein, partial [Xanthomonadales bacterium]|nr:delta-60 repeat domain-containing protein [Xanthomonadales bacterium]